MKKIQSKYIFISKITGIVLLSLLGMWLLLHTLYFSAILILLFIIALSVSLYYERKKIIDKMERMIESIRHSDFSYHFTNAQSGDELSRLYREMNQALDVFRARTQDSMKDEAETQAWQKLISVLTHEIMNSVAPIISLSETLSEHPLSDTPDVENYAVMKQAMETIHRRSKGLLTFVENYRKLTRIPDPLLESIHLGSMLKLLQQLMASDTIYFTYSVYPENLFLYADRSMVEQVFINLIKNAHEACPDTSTAKIEVKAVKIGSEIQIAFSDKGTGISADVIDKIFIPFYSTKSNGSGIGLSLCRQMMIRHKGKISVLSAENGSVFTVHFKA